MELNHVYALIAMNGLESSRNSLARQAVDRALAAAEILSPALDLALESPEKFAAKVREAGQAARKLRGRAARTLEKESFSALKAMGVMEEAPALMGSDMLYATSGVELMVWRGEEDAWRKAVEEFRAELLEPGESTVDCGALFWLLRESCVLNELFSTREQGEVRSRVTALAAENPVWRCLVEEEFHDALIALGLKAMRAKRSMFRNPYLEGVALFFPFLERRASIFIDQVVLGTTVKERRTAVVEYLKARGHRVREVPSGGETLLEIDGSFYRAWPTTRTVRLPIQGMALVPVYL